MNNELTIILYKSMRKNSKCIIINKKIFTNKNMIQNIDIYDILEKIINISKIYDNKLIVSYSLYENGNNILKIPKKRIFSLEQLINELITIINSINKDKNNIKDIHNNKDIRYLINKYYNSKEDTRNER